MNQYRNIKVLKLNHLLKKNLFIFDFDGVICNSVNIKTNAFFDLSEKQFNELKLLYNKDYIIAARAWGDNVWNHMKRNWVIISFDQLISVWIIFLSNTLIYEIMCQKKGIGFEIYKNIIDNKGNLSNQTWAFEFDLFYILLIFVIILISSVNFFRKLILEYLIDIKR